MMPSAAASTTLWQGDVSQFDHIEHICTTDLNGQLADMEESLLYAQLKNRLQCSFSIGQSLIPLL